MAIGFLMGVMTINFALPIDIYKSLWNSDNGYFTKIFLKLLNYWFEYHDHLENTLQFFMNSIAILVFLTCSILSAKTHPLFYVSLVI